MNTRLSKPLQLGKAGEHYVCFDLMAQGYNAFLSDQGLPFDVIVEKDGRLVRVQVKTITGLSSYGATENIFRFTTRHGSMAKGKTGRAMPIEEVDYFAFFVASTRQVAYMAVKDLVSKNTGMVKQIIEFKTKGKKYPTHPNWKGVHGKFIEDYSTFSL